MSERYLDSAEVSDLGLKRKNNEDAYLCLPEKGFFCVADGMGGIAGGDIASEAITTNLQDAFAIGTPANVSNLERNIELVKSAVNSASHWIKTFSDEKVAGQMGSTLVALVIDPLHPTKAVSLHAGDSRLYRFRDRQLTLLTADHSAMAALAAKLGKDPSTLPAKYRHELVRAVGLTESVELEEHRVEVTSHDLFLLCSDGLTGMVADERITAVLQEAEGAKRSIRSTAQRLVDEAKEAGGKDNVTVVLVKVGDIEGWVRKDLEEAADEEKTACVDDVSQSDTAATCQLGVADRSAPSNPGEQAVHSASRVEESVSGSSSKLISNPRVQELTASEPPRRRSVLGRWGIPSFILLGILSLAVWYIFSTRPLVHEIFEDQILGEQPAFDTLRELEPSVRREKAYLEAMEAGQQAIYEGDFKRASEKARQALEAKPRDPKAQELQSDAQRGLERLEKQETERRLLGAGSDLSH